MRVTINPTLNLETMTWLPRPSYEYCGPVMLCKGDDTAQLAEQKQLTVTDQIMNMFQAQYNDQEGILNFLKTNLQPQVTNPKGMSDADLAAARTLSTDTVAQQTKNAQIAANAAAARTGGAALPSGVSTMIEASAAEQGAQQQAQQQNQITLANQQLKEQNYLAAISGLTGVSQVNPLSASSSVNQGFSNIAPLSESVTQANGPGVGQIIGGLVGGAANAFLGGFGKSVGA
jgi:hypothetical protein